jgi:hypothetical protein
VDLTVLGAESWRLGRLCIVAGEVRLRGSGEEPRTVEICHRVRSIISQTIQEIHHQFYDQFSVTVIVPFWVLFIGLCLFQNFSRSKLKESFLQLFRGKTKPKLATFPFSKYLSYLVSPRPRTQNCKSSRKSAGIFRFNKTFQNV